jgi:F-box protein 18 (helicase)
LSYSKYSVATKNRSLGNNTLFSHGMNLTEQQLHIINTTGNLKINAVAGSGKTTTMIEYAKSRPAGSRILYLAFNKSVRLEAETKFRAATAYHVQIETAHSLAYKAIVPQTNYTIKLGDYKPYEVVRILELSHIGSSHDVYVVANHILKMAAYFCNSKAMRVSELDYLSTIYDKKAKAFAKFYYKSIEQNTRLFLAKMNSAEIEITHDFYLKKYQLSNPTLPYDYILFDEGQDASPAMLDVFLKQQKAIKVIVGDMHQQIYSWRYAINSLSQVDFPDYFLTHSFRFGACIASLATESLKLKKYLGDVNFSELIGSGTTATTATKAIIARTNLGLLIKAINYITDHRQVKHIYFEGNFNSYTYADDGASLYDVLNLYNRKTYLIRDELLKTMHSIQELEDYIEKTDDKQLQMMLDIVKEYENEIPFLLKQLKDKHVTDAEKHKAEMVFSTVHRCKGMEYDIVELANDFIHEDKLVRLKWQTDFEEQKSRIEEEINLLYVAITRAKSLLKIPEELVPDEFKIDATIQLLKKPEPKTKPDMVVPNYTQRKSTQPFAKDNGSYYHRAKETHSGTYKPWTPELDQELEDLFEEGFSYQIIATEMERTKGAIISRLKKLGLISG